MRYLLTMTVDRTRGLVSKHTLVGIWLSSLTDPVEFWRILISALNQPTQWRDRKYES
ncbi:hypothetical protein QUB63_29125 [Microcoleus sp. ARI1-B5]|uniref:hypothetical protein n=1 Tax=unclassified Microcoleus TaxID=2642155 RepID=UPI002FD3F7EF